ncbi:MAG: hypothetical protein ACYCYI_11075 [Saccharofermentanales bacterium]
MIDIKKKMSIFYGKMRDFFNSLKPVAKKGWKDTKTGIKTVKNFNTPKVYRLRGYTTTSKVDIKIRKEQNQRTLRNILVAAIFVLILAVLLIVFNPFKDLREIFRMIGIG